MRFHHVQLAMPRGREDEARRFYAELLGLEELPKIYTSDPFGNRLELIQAPPE